MVSCWRGSKSWPELKDTSGTLILEDTTFQLSTILHAKIMMTRKHLD